MQLQPVDQFDRAVMLQRQPIGERADGGLFSFGKAPDREQQQVLLRLQARGAGHGVSLTDKFTDEVAQLRERGVLRRGDLL